MDSILLQQLILENLYRIGGPVLMMAGGVSCIVSFIVFTKKHLRKSPCSIYFATLSITEFLSTCTALFFQTLSFGYNIDITIYNTVVCRTVYYALFVLGSLNYTYLVFASIDRILITSSNARTRQKSTRRLAAICIISSSLFWVVFNIHALVLTTIQQYGPNYYFCYLQPGIYTDLVSYYSLFKAVLIPLIMIICGVWTVKNLRSLHQVRVAPISMASRTTAANNQQSTSPKDRQLVLMLLIDVAIYIVFNSMIAAVLVEQQITQYETKAYERIQLENFLVIVGGFCTNIPYCVGLYTKLLVSKTFRNEVKNVFTTIQGFCMRHLPGA